MKNRSILIAGYGSIGKKYVEILSKKNIQLIVFDPKKFKSKNKKIIFLNDYKTLIKEIKKRKVRIAIISSLANTHYKNFSLFSKIGINKILIEKPVTNNLCEYMKIIKYSKNKKLSVGTHFKWSVLKLNEIIKKIEDKNNLGKPLQFNTQGGANCLATGGIHWIDFFINHFKIYDEKIEIFSNLSLDKINPRGKDFYNIGGSILLKHKTKGSAIFTYNNQSRLAPLQTILYTSHMLKFDILGNYKIYRTNKNLDNLKITRYGVPKIIRSGNFLNKKVNSINLIIDNLLHKNKPLVPLTKSIKTFKIFVGVIISNRKEKLINYKAIDQIAKKEKFYNKNLKFT